MSGFFNKNYDRSSYMATHSVNPLLQTHTSSNTQNAKQLTYYPEQELKFLSQAIKNCIKDIPQLESRLFNINPGHCTGVFLCLFLFRSIKRLVNFKEHGGSEKNLIEQSNVCSALKCLRYIISALTVLFVEHSSSNTHSASSLKGENLYMYF